MPTDLWPAVRRGSKKWFAELERSAISAADALDEGGDASVYLARMEELTGQPVDPVEFMAKQGPKRGRKLRAWLRKATGRKLPLQRLRLPVLFQSMEFPSNTSLN